VVLLAGGLLSPAVAQVSGVTLREQLVMDYLRHCVDANPRGGDCVEVAERWFRDGPDAFGRRVAWLQAASIYRGLIMAADDDDAALHATATERAAQIYRAVLDGFPADFAALSGLAWMQPSRTERLAALQDYLRVHPDDETVWYIVSMMLARGRETAPPRSALKSQHRRECNPV
jgi:hypothetical protein